MSAPKRLGGPPLPRIADKPLRELVHEAIRLGATPSICGSGHVKLTRPGCQPVIVASSPRGQRVVLHTRGQLRRLGYLALPEKESS